MRSLRELLPTNSHQEQERSSDRVFDEKTVFFLFGQVIEREYGKRGQAAIFPTKYADKVLTVQTKSPLWSNELFIQKGELLEKLSAQIGQGVVEDIKTIHSAIRGNE